MLFLSVKAHILYTATNDYLKQVPLTDYPLTVITETQNKNGWIGWTAHMPLTTDGSWLYVWNGPGLSTVMKIEFRQCLFLRGDVVHARERPMVDSIHSLYPRLHFYILTTLQEAPINKIFLVELNGRTSWKKLTNSPNGNWHKVTPTILLLLNQEHKKNLYQNVIELDTKCKFNVVHLF